jgi:hypothetical protein
MITLALLAGSAMALSRCAGPKYGGLLHDAGPLGDGGPGCQTPACEASQLQAMARGFMQFHADTTGWPLGHSAWYAISSDPVASNWSVFPGLAFAGTDTAMFVRWNAINECGSTHTAPCWAGPYLNIDGPEPNVSLGATPWLDVWGHPRMYSYIQPMGGSGGQTKLPNGVIYLWSRGPDGKDGFTCSDGDPTLCPHGVNIALFAMGECSQPTDCDDVIVEVADSSM